MVGSVLMHRMQEENDFRHFTAKYFTTSQLGQNAPNGTPLADANDLDELAACDILVSCQGGDYTNSVHGPLRSAGWNGYWIDAASTLRMAEQSVITLDPVNRDRIDQGIDQGIKDLVGGNCTVSLMLMAIGALFREGWVEWVSSMTYQSASGAGAANMLELVAQMEAIASVTQSEERSPAATALDVDQLVNETLSDESFPTDGFGAPLAASLIPWIDRRMDDGSTREEWKGMAETNKILGCTPKIPVDGLCVRVGAMRCHSQALTIKLKQDIPLDDIESAISDAHAWSGVVSNDRGTPCARASRSTERLALIVSRAESDF